MLRNVDINEISDGKKYSIHDMARLGCRDCEGCHKCCGNMGDTIVLDPYDVFRITEGTGMDFNTLIMTAAKLTVVDNIVLPVLNLGNGNCHFLDENGRCRIHPFRPGICRLFPLGRLFENNTHSYFLQKDECTAVNRTKVRIDKGIGEKDIAGYEKYTDAWHYFVRHVGEAVAGIEDEQEVRRVSMLVLNELYLKPYDRDLDFFKQFYDRKEYIRDSIE